MIVRVELTEEETVVTERVTAGDGGCCGGEEERESEERDFKRDVEEEAAMDEGFSRCFSAAAMATLVFTLAIKFTKTVHGLFVNIQL